MTAGLRQRLAGNEQARARNHAFFDSSRQRIVGAAGIAHFTDAVRDCIDAGIFGAGDPLPIALDLWAAAHGIASLIIAKPYLPWGDHEAIVDRVLCTAALDPLRDQGRAYAAAVIAAGGQLTYREFPGTIHGFCTYRAAIPSARADLAVLLDLAAAMLEEIGAR